METLINIKSESGLVPSPSLIESDSCLIPPPNLHLPPKTDIKNESYVIPSQVYDEEFVYPSEISGQERIEDRTFGGWWLVFSNIQKRDEGLTAHDRLWFKIKPHVIIEELIFASASTSAQSAHTSNQGNGVICVYTKDYRDSDDVRGTAEKIRQYLGKSDIIETLYYKIDEARRAQEYAAFGNTKISLYRQELDGSFYKRVGENRDWHLIYKPSSPPQLA